MFKKLYLQWYYPILMCLGLFFVDASAQAKTPNDTMQVASFAKDTSDTLHLAHKVAHGVLNDPVAVDIIPTPMQSTSFRQSLSSLWQNLPAISKSIPKAVIQALDSQRNSASMLAQETLAQLNQDVEALKLPTSAPVIPYPMAERVVANKHMTWHLSKNDRSVKQLFERWSEQAGYQLKWQMEQDFSLDAQAQFNGTLDSAMNAVLSHLESTNDPLVAEFFEGNKVIRVRQK